MKQNDVYRNNSCLECKNSYQTRNSQARLCPACSKKKRNMSEAERWLNKKPYGAFAQPYGFLFKNGGIRKYKGHFQ